MLEYIALDLPQLPVDPIYPIGIAVNSPPELRPYFIHSYLQEKVFHFAARHASINQWLRVTYLRHQEHMQEDLKMEMRIWLITLIIINIYANATTKNAARSRGRNFKGNVPRSAWD
jgi:hypothetical protein